MTLEDQNVSAVCKRRYLSEVEVILFGFAMILGNRNVAWNQSLAFGFDSYLFNMFFVGSAYFCLCLCMGEITSALPFSGGIFGFVRASAGPFIAYITAWYEIAFILTYIIIKVDQVMKILIALKVMSGDLTPIAILIFYATSFLWNLIGGKIFWRFVTFLGFGVLFLHLVYLGGAADLSVRNHSLDYGSFCRTTIPLSMDNIMSSRNNLYGLYQGLQFIPLLSDSLRKPREQVPQVLIICSMTFVVLSVFLSLSSCSQYPGITKLTKAKYPLVYGFSNVFNVSLQDSIWFNVPGMYGVAFCLFYCGGKQIHAISKSGLLFKVFATTTPLLGSFPYMSYLATAIIGTGLNIYVFYYPDAFQEIRNVSVITSHFIFLFAFVAYLLFKLRHSSLTRSFHSPLGVYGAWYGFLNYLLGLIWFLFFADNGYHSLYSVCCLTGVISIYFWWYLVKHQQFSEEEKKLMFKAYLINANRAKRNRMCKGNKVGCNIGTNTKISSDVSQNNNKKDESLRPVECVPGFSEDAIQSSPTFLNPAPQSPMTESDVSNEKITQLQVLPSSSESQKIQGPSQKSMSTKLSNFLSAKFNSVLPSEIAEKISYENDENQILVLSAGGILNDSVIESLKAKYGIDIESSENIEC